ncbi:DNA replication licensing factor, mcm4 component [Tritrichomonas musculus]|uniref:DNA replication licensing factor MCM4 n=1 Tax=Tritrichomonas musculus TaxID=1915356 RepID=A0ABR2K5Y5_9EUKA
MSDSNIDNLDSQSQSQSQTQDSQQSQIKIQDEFNTNDASYHSLNSADSLNSSFLHDPESYTSHTLAYGTNVNITAASNKLRQFLQSFELEDNENDDGETKALYLHKIKQMPDADNYYLNIDMHHLYQYDKNLYKQVIDFPLEMVQLADTIVKELFQTLFPNYVDDIHRVQTRMFNLMETTTIRDLQPADIDKLVSVRGMVTRTSSVIPDLTEAALRCRQCNHIEMVPVTHGSVVDPGKCVACGGTNTYDIDHALGRFTDRQHMKIQESPESIPQGETPQSIAAICFEDLVDYARPGDRVEITGIWKAVPSRINPRVRTLNAVYRTYIDVIHIRKSFTTQIDNEERQRFDETANIKETEEKRRRMAEELSNDPNIYDKLIQSFAPSIWGMENVKKGLLCLLFGGSTNSRGTRGDINIILVGDPATAKSQLIQYTHKVSPRGLYTSGKGSSAVGLTASVVRDSETGEFVLESGALVLSDRGVCCIDEFDKMNDSARAVLHEVMEQQTVSVAKAGIVCTLNARAAIVACANPRDSQYNPKLSVIENIQLPPTLLSRFDLVYLILDRIDEAHDMQLARHIVSLYTSSSDIDSEIPINQLTEYIAYAKEHCNPSFTDESQKILVDGYTEMRLLGGRNVVSATPRQLESCIRIAEANAKMRLSPYVEKQDAEEALRLLKEALHQAATDPQTGLIDIDNLATGTSAEKRQKIARISKEIVTMLQAVSDLSLSFNAIASNIRAAMGTNVTDSEISDALFALEADSQVFLVVEGSKPTKATLYQSGRR